MSDAIDRAARAEAERKGRDEYWYGDSDVFAAGAAWAVAHLREAGLLATAPLREAYVVTAWTHARWIEGHPPVPGETKVRDTHGADALYAKCATCHEVVVPARFERVPVGPAEGDGCSCTGHRRDYGGYVEYLMEYEPSCPEHSEHVWNPRTGIWEHASTHPAPTELPAQPAQPELPAQPAPDF